MERRELIFRVFVSSTFSDLIVERNELQNSAFRNLRQYCQDHGARFLAIDLRWGVNEEASLDQQTMKICLQELKRCQLLSPRPNFIVLLGNRYGWRPLPSNILAAEMEEIIHQLEPHEISRIIWRDGQHHDNTGWYRLDRNADPPEYSLQPRTGVFEDFKEWEKEETILRDILIKGLKDVPNEIISDRGKYFESATHQEIHQGALKAVNPETHVFCYFRNIDKLPGDETAKNYIDIKDGQTDHDAQTRLKKLKELLSERLPKEHVHDDYRTTWSGAKCEWEKEELRRFCNDVEKDLKKIISFEIEAFKRRSELEQEITAHTDYAKDVSLHFTGYTEPLARIKRYLEDPATDQPLVLHGVSGTGKSALMAHVWLTMTDTENSVVRFIGVTPGSTNMRTLLQSLCQQLGIKSPSNDSLDLMKAFREYLSLGTSCVTKAHLTHPIVIFLDGLDQVDIDGNAWKLTRWIPRKLAAKVKMIISVLQTTGPANKYFESAQNIWPESMIEVGFMEVTDAEALLRKCLQSINRTLSITGEIDQMSFVIDAFRNNRRPLYLKLAFEQAQRWMSWDKPSPMGTCIEDMLQQVLERLEQRKQHGRILVERALGNIASGRHGLTEDELLDVLSSDDEVMADFYDRSPVERNKNPEDKVKLLPIVVWSRLYEDLKPYMAQRLANDTIVMNYRYRQVKEAVERRYISEGSASQTAAHDRLGTYFQRKASPYDNWDQVPLRALSELPFQWLNADNMGNKMDRLEQLLCDPIFLEASIKRGLLDQILEDLNYSAQKTEGEKIIPVRNAVFSGVVAIRQRPHLALQTISNRLRNEPIGSGQRVYLNRVEDLLDKRGPWLCSMSPFGATGNVQGIIGISPQRELFHVLTEKNELEDYDVNTCRLIEKQPLFNGYTPLFIAIHRVTGQVVWLDNTGNVHIDDDITSIRLRTREHCLSFLGDGLVGIDPNGSLVFWEPKQKESSYISDLLDRTSAKIFLSPDYRTAVVISGDRLPGQKILILDAHDHIPIAGEWPALASPISCACLDNEGTILFATRDRKLQRLNIRSRHFIQETSYRAAGSKTIRGIAEQCIMTSYAGQTFVVIATTEGELCIWDCLAGDIKKRGQFRGVREQSNLRVLEALPQKGKFAVASEVKMELLNLSGNDTFKIATPITQCSLSHDGWLVTAKPFAKRVTWYKDDHHYEDFLLLNLEPISVASCGSDGSAFVGYSNGCVVKLHPDKKTPELEDAVDLFDRAVISVISLDDERVLATSVNGQSRIALFQPIRVIRDIRPIGNIREEQIVRRLGAGDDFVCSGRYHSSDSRWTVNVTRRDNSRELVFETPEMVLDIAASWDGLAIYAVFGGKVHRCRFVRGKWKQDAEREKEDIMNIVACQDGFLGVVLQEKGLSWLEIWSSAGMSMETVAAMELPFQCKSICSSGNSIAVGAIDGEHCMITLKYGRNQ